MEVRETLEKILKAKELPHAWLFSGPRGTGKTSSARILAKTINDDETVLDTPDVIEIDAASNRGIDDIRSLREGIALAPMGAKYKVYIIDEVHMLTTEAFNALLKTLEEPPKHVVFVLCTTEAQKLPETVVSRCTQVQFKKPSITEIVEKLKRVEEQESGRVEVDELERIAKASKGSFRDAIKMLEQVILTGKPMEVGVEPDEFVRLVQEGETKKALEFVNELVESGGNVRGFIERAVEYLREELLNSLDRSVMSLIEGLEKAYERTKTTAVEQLPLEMFVIEKAGGQESKRIKVESTPSPTVSSSKVGFGKYKLNDVVEKWQDVLKAVKPLNHSVEALLRSTRPMDFDGRSLKLEVFYKFHKDKLESEKCRQIVENGVAEVFGINPVRLILNLGERQNKQEDVVADVEDDIVKAAEEIFKVSAI